MMWKPPLGARLQAVPSRSTQVPLGRTCPSRHMGLQDNGVQGDPGRKAEAGPTFHIEMSPTQVRMDQIMSEITDFVNVNESFQCSHSLFS